MRLDFLVIVNAVSHDTNLRIEFYHAYSAPHIYGQFGPYGTDRHNDPGVTTGQINDTVFCIENDFLDHCGDVAQIHTLYITYNYFCGDISLFQQLLIALDRFAHIGSVADHNHSVRLYAQTSCDIINVRACKAFNQCQMESPLAYKTFQT